MKTIKLLTLAVLLTFTFSCSKEDNSTTNQNSNWTATLEDDCGNQTSQFNICVTEEEKDRAFNQTVIGEPCNWVTVRDINGNSHSGYWRRAFPSSDCE